MQAWKARMEAQVQKIEGKLASILMYVNREFVVYNTYNGCRILGDARILVSHTCVNVHWL
jgi:hypothetical protein